MNSQTSSSSDFESHVSSASRYVLDGWFPVCREYFEDLKLRLTKDTYRDFGALYKDIRKDFALCTWLYKSNPPSKSSPRDDSPGFSDLLKQVEFSSLKDKIMRLEPDQVSLHVLEEGSSHQIREIGSMAIASGTTEVLAQESGLPADLGFSASLVRSIGTALIAWNYPHVYERGKHLASQDSKDKSLDYSISRLIGFSPILLSRQVAKQIKIPELIQKSLESESSQGKNLALKNLRECCLIADSFARSISSDEDSPLAKEKQSQALKRVTEKAGTKSLQKIIDSIETLSSGYTSTLKLDFGLSKISDLKATLKEKTGEYTLKR